MRILRAADRVATPWKNGGGITREVAAWPEGAGFHNFHWRVSLAEVSGDGPFSVFPDVDRILAVLQGRLVLRIAGQSERVLTAATPPAEFPGDAATFGAVAEGPVQDLNLMARRGVVRARLEWLRVDGDHVLPASLAQRLVIPTDGRLRCGPTASSTASRSLSPAGGGGSAEPDSSGTAPIHGEEEPRSGGGGGGAVLGPLDALVLQPGETMTLRAERSTTVYVASFEP